MNSLPGGVPLTPAEQERKDQWASLRQVVDQAFRLMPGGPGQGDGPTPAQVDSVVQTLVFLYRVTGDDRPLYEWLGVALGVDRDEGMLQASVAVRDIFMAPRDGAGADLEIDGELDIDEADWAAERFATLPEEATRR